MRFHKFWLCNPCGPCEWHIESAVRIFAWFDLVFQAVFVVPVVLQFKILLSTLHQNTNEENPGASRDHELHYSTTPDAAPVQHCVSSQLSVIYSIVDINNLSIGMLTDIFLYIGAKQTNTTFSLVCGWFFLVGVIIREILHVAGAYITITNCEAYMYPYEFTGRLLCHYMLWGVWIVIEYMLWLRKGRQFVPQYGQRDPPVGLQTSLSLRKSKLVEKWTAQSLVASAASSKSRASMLQSHDTLMSSGATTPLERFPKEKKEKEEKHDEEHGELKKRKSKRSLKKHQGASDELLIPESGIASTDLKPEEVKQEESKPKRHKREGSKSDGPARPEGPKPEGTARREVSRPGLKRQVSKAESQKIPEGPRQGSKSEGRKPEGPKADGFKPKKRSKP